MKYTLALLFVLFGLLGAAPATAEVIVYTVTIGEEEPVPCLDGGSLVIKENIDTQEVSHMEYMCVPTSSLQFQNTAPVEGGLVDESHQWSTLLDQNTLDQILQILEPIHSGLSDESRTAEEEGELWYSEPQ